jgi:hypothetical protein
VLQTFAFHPPAEEFDSSDRSDGNLHFVPETRHAILVFGYIYWVRVVQQSSV